jgi:hypothetical protein
MPKTIDFKDPEEDALYGTQLITLPGGEQVPQAIATLVSGQAYLMRQGGASEYRILLEAALLAYNPEHMIVAVRDRERLEGMGWLVNGHIGTPIAAVLRATITFTGPGTRCYFTPLPREQLTAVE